MIKKRNAWEAKAAPLEPCSSPHSLLPRPVPAEVLYYTDDTAMARALVQSLLSKEAFDEVDMAHR